MNKLHMNKIFRINIFFGLSIILKYYYVFETLIKNNVFDKIFVSIDYNQLKIYREFSTIEYYNNYLIFINYINSYDRIIIENVYNPSYKLMDLCSLSKKFNIPVKFKIYDKLINAKFILPFDYVTISTKIINVPYKLYEKYKRLLFNNLNNIGYKVIILGERKITDCNEHNIHEVYSIYNDLIGSLTNYIDNTICDDSNNNSLDNFIRSSTIFNKSKLNIYIGNGGISEILGYVSSNILGLTFKDNILNRNNYLSNINNIKNFNNFDSFIENLKID